MNSAAGRCHRESRFPQIAVLALEPTEIGANLQTRRTQQSALSPCLRGLSYLRSTNLIWSPCTVQSVPAGAVAT